MAKTKTKNKRTPWYLKLNCHKCDNDFYILSGRAYYRQPKDDTCINVRREFELRELITEDELILKTSLFNRETNTATFHKLEILNKVNTLVKSVDEDDVIQVKVKRGNYTYTQSRNGYKISNLHLEIISTDIIYLLRYYDSDTKQFSIPFKDFRINNRTENPTIELLNKKL